ncbi:MAG TPA: helix-turn-helix domain-containing protein [Actinomycetales bacterium]|nr:helix-turn-helix domain-containing protein [Actinomycetales bacterium]
MSTPETSQTLDRGIRLLSLLSDGRSMSVTELATTLGVARPVVYRLLATFDAHAWTSRTQDGRVRLGLGVLQLAQQVQPWLRRAAVPELRRLADRVGATAHLTVADGDEGLAVAVVEPTWTDYHVSYRVGSRHPLDRGAAGRAILAHRSGEESIVTTDGELQPGAVGIAVPIPVTGLEASVGVVTLGTLERDGVEDALRTAARRIAHALG